MDLTKDSFTARIQSESLKTMKSILSVSEAIVLLDFPENYTFVVQNEKQRFY